MEKEWKEYLDFRKYDYEKMKDRFYNIRLDRQQKRKQIAEKQLQLSGSRLKNKKKSQYAIDTLEESYHQLYNKYNQCTVKDAKVYYPYKHVHSRHCGCNITNIKSRCHTI